MKYEILFAILLTALPALTQEQRNADGKAEKDSQADSILKVLADPEGHPYFPKDRESYDTPSYTRYLAAMKEPSISRQLPDGVECIYRLTILPTFSDRMSIRISKKGGRYEMRAIQLRCNYAHDPVEIVHDETRILDESLSGPLVSLFSREQLWIKFTNLEKAVMDSVKDRIPYIFERRTEEGYEMIDPHSPSVGVLFLEDHPHLSTKDFKIYDRIADRLIKEAGFPAQANSADPK
ncbi:MAG: hypothetical protein KDN20_11325 [Verrucomicrobiae bacterium]|nr:hypothetical protein [Verrucomicrobiae bacterium]